MGIHLELNAWLMPTVAREEWLRLTALLDELPDQEVPCRADPGAWWPSGQGDAPAAIDACRGCPARDACLAYALAADERFGIWGGTLPTERRASPVVNHH